MKKILPILMLLLLLSVCIGLSAGAESAPALVNDLYYMANSENSDTAIYPQGARGGQYYMFLPSSADLTQLVLFADESYTSLTLTGDAEITAAPGEAFDLTAVVSGENDEYTVSVSAEKTDGTVNTLTITFMKSAKVRSMYLVSEDPLDHGRTWVDSSKSNEATGHISIVSADGTVDHSDKLTQLKARGNTTFVYYEKKAYQIKINKKAALIGEDSNKSKKWILLANAADITLIHNSITFFMAKELQLPYAMDYEPIDLYYDGEYRGSYLLTEKVEIGDSRIEIENLDDIIENANEGTDAYENPVTVTKTRKSGGDEDAKESSAGSYKYVQGLSEPTLGEGLSHHAFLMELELIHRYATEQTGFVTDRGQAVVTKNPEYLTKDTGAFISQFFQDFEDAVFSPDGYNEATGKYYYEYCDLDSLVNIYLINEYAKNYDSFRSSAFFYLPEDEDIMYAGPIWDYDICYGTGYDGNRQIAANPENFFASTKYMLSTLITIESFRDAVKDALSSDGGRFYHAAQKLLGDDGIISAYSDQVYASQKMNYKLWDINNKATTALFCDDEVTYDNAIKFLKFFAENRFDWLSETVAKWSGSTYSAPADPSFPTTYRYHTGVVNHSGLAATCTEAGHSSGTECTVCGTVFKQRTEIAAKGHNWVETCGAPKTCKTCGATEGGILDHDYQRDVSDSRNSDTCIVYRCTRCKKVLLVTVAPKFEQGDINLDGKISAADARIALRISAKLEQADEMQLRYGDMNGDKVITAADARIILRKSAQLEN